MFKRFKEWVIFLIAGPTAAMFRGSTNKALCRQFYWKYNFKEKNYWIRDEPSQTFIPLILPFSITVEEIMKLRDKLSLLMDLEEKRFTMSLAGRVVIGETSHYAAIYYGEPKYNDGGYFLELTPEGRRIATHRLFLDNFNLS